MTQQNGKHWDLQTALKAMGKSFKYILKMYNFSTMQKYKDAIWIMRGFMNLKGQRQLHYEPAYQKDAKADRFPSSRSA